MRTECSAIIEQHVKTLLAQSGCLVDSEAGTTEAEAGTADDVDDAMIMSSAGVTVELFIPSRNKTCRLPDTTTHRYGHTVDGLRDCGAVHPLPQQDLQAARHHHPQIRTHSGWAACLWGWKNFSQLRILFQWSV